MKIDAFSYLISSLDNISICTAGRFRDKCVISIVCAAESNTARVFFDEGMIERGVIGIRDFHRAWLKNLFQKLLCIRYAPNLESRLAGKNNTHENNFLSTKDYWAGTASSISL